MQAGWDGCTMLTFWYQVQWRGLILLNILMTAKLGFLPDWHGILPCRTTGMAYLPSSHTDWGVL